MAAMTLAGAAVAGIVTQSLARWLRFPGIVLLLAVGVLLGPDVAGVIRPSALGGALPEVVGFAVAVILFVGGMHLDVSRFRKQHRAIRRLVTYGAVVTAVGGTLAARLIMGWDWRLAALFGCLVIVTGPTVVTPLVRRFKLAPSVTDVLEAEAVLIDAIGAVIAVVALEVALEPSMGSIQDAALGITTRLAGGALLGLAGGVALWGLLRQRSLIADGLENVFTLALYKGADFLLPESGIVAVTVAGLTLGNLRTRAHDGLVDFKDQLAVLLIGTLFVLLAADTSLAELTSLGWPAALTVVALIVIVRPLNVLLATTHSPLETKERLFVAWFAPRGIIAAAVASLYATELTAAGFEGGQMLNAMVFLVIVATVLLAGVTGRPIANLLGLTQQPRGWLILGANPLAVQLARILIDCGEEVVVLDRAANHCRAAEACGVPAIQGNGLDDAILHEAKIGLRAGVAGATPNNEINLLFIKTAKRLGSVPKRVAALKRGAYGASREMVHREGGRILFGFECNVDRWMGLVGNDETTVRMLTAGSAATLQHDVEGTTLAVPLVHRRADAARPVTEDLDIRSGDVAYFLVAKATEAEAITWLAARGWRDEGPRIAERSGGLT
jgi:NhaP-type Na+/H+ or K+/H+ antiporter